MTIDTANALCRYFEALYNLNQNLIVLCGVGVIDSKGDPEKRLDDIIMSVPRLVPYNCNKETSEYKISRSDGLMRFSNDIPFLKDDYETNLKKHLEFLKKIKKVRNKLEHEMHGARIVASTSGTMSLFHVTYEVNEDTIDLTADEIISFVKDINIIFAKLQKLVMHTAYEHKFEDHPYYWRLIRYDFSDFNKILESNLLHIFGKALVSF